MVHDSRGSDVGHENILGGLTHSQELAIHLQGLIQSEETLNYCLGLEETAFQLKHQFYDQFYDQFTRSIHPVLHTRP
jgi:hypothetical protein